MNYLIKENEWQSILLLLHQQKHIYIGSEITLRRFIEAICYIVRSGCQWRLLSSCYGYGRSVHRRFKRWGEKGVWEKVFQLSQHNPDTEVLMVDAIMIRAHACSAGYEKDGHTKQALGRSRGGFPSQDYVERIETLFPIFPFHFIF